MLKWYLLMCFKPLQHYLMKTWPIPSLQLEVILQMCLNLFWVISAHQLCSVLSVSYECETSGPDLCRLRKPRANMTKAISTAMPSIIAISTPITQHIITALQLHCEGLSLPCWVVLKNSVVFMPSWGFMPTSHWSSVLFGFKQPTNIEAI